MRILSSVHNLTDEELVEKIVKTKSGLLFGVLYDRYSRIIFNKCYGFCYSEDEAKDLTQEVFIKLFIQLGKYRDTHKFSTWLSVFTYNLCVNYVTRDVSKKINKKAVPIEESALAELETDDNELLNLRVDRLEKVLEIIPAEDKMILLLKYKDDLSIKELSELLDIGQSAVKMRLKRSKARLTKIYNEN